MSQITDVNNDDGQVTLPSMRQVGYNQQKLVNYINSIKQPNSNFNVVAYTGVTLPANAYSTGVYSPIQNRIYLIPFYAASTQWYYINCETGIIVPYTAISLSNGSYDGGVYSPTQNRIYLVPYLRSANSQWHYIDCNLDTVVPYTHGMTLQSESYEGGVYSPIQNRIYFVKSYQSTTWHYINCDTGIVVAYNGVEAANRGYIGGVYSPTQNRIYLVPFGQANLATWHYIDCNITGPTGMVIAYTHGVTAVNSGYIGGVYSPTQNRIYFVPHAQGSQTKWHYIDCNVVGPTGMVIEYTHGVTTSIDAYAGGVYSPTQNRIYLVPHVMGLVATWHYIDCETGDVVPYTHGVTVSNRGYIGGVYSPTQNRIYLVPYNIIGTTFHYIQPHTSKNANISLMSGAMFNKY